MSPVGVLDGHQTLEEIERLVSEERPTETFHEQSVDWDEEDGGMTPCWAHSEDCNWGRSLRGMKLYNLWAEPDHCSARAHHGCDEPETGRAGLCPLSYCRNPGNGYRTRDATCGMISSPFPFLYRGVELGPASPRQNEYTVGRRSVGGCRTTFVRILRRVQAARILVAQAGSAA